MEKSIPLTEAASVVRGCLATLELELSPLAHETVELYLATILNDYEFDDHEARLNLKARMAARLT